MALLHIFFTFENWSKFTSIVWEFIEANLPFETPVQCLVFCELKRFTRPSISKRVSRLWLIITGTVSCLSASTNYNAIHSWTFTAQFNLDINPVHTLQRTNLASSRKCTVIGANMFALKESKVCSVFRIGCGFTKSKMHIIWLHVSSNRKQSCCECRAKAAKARPTGSVLYVLQAAVADVLSVALHISGPRNWYFNITEQNSREKEYGAAHNKTLCTGRGCSYCKMSKEHKSLSLDDFS